MDFSDKAFVLSGLYAMYRNEPLFRKFCATQDIGLPLSYVVATGLADITPDGQEFVNETWNNYCAWLRIDPNEKYETLEETFLASPVIILGED